MNAKSVVVIFVTVILLGLASPVYAHRLDEYLQATTIKLIPDHLELDLRLTPGVQVFAKVLSDIDADGNGIISDTERRAYAERVRHDLFLSIDGVPQTLGLMHWEYPSVDAMEAGLGEIVLKFNAKIPPVGSNHRVIFENHFHEGGAAAYLVNCLVPSDPALHVVAQDRSYDQSIYRLDYMQIVSPTIAISNVSWLQRNGGWSLVRAYLYHGIRHILTGYDHLLFVSALVLASVTLWDLVKVVTTFTIAHTLTLTLAALNVIHLSDRVIEPLISASIIFVALQNVFWPSRARGWSRIAAAFFFGLFHGLGFAGGLMDAMQEMQGGTMFLAILCFSIGVEAGHQMVVLPMFGILQAVRFTLPEVVTRARTSMAIQRIGSVLISMAGVYYLWVALVRI